MNSSKGKGQRVTTESNNSRESEDYEFNFFGLKRLRDGGEPLNSGDL